MATRPVPVLTQDNVDTEIARLTTDGDRIAEALVALEGHPGYGFLQRTTLSGRTERLWQAASAEITVLYQWFDAYRTVLDDARRIRARRNRPGATELAELSTLLRGSTIVLSTEEIPLGQRNLTGPTTITHTMTLTELVGAMDRAFGRCSDLVVAADDVWSAVVKLLDPLDQRVERARELCASLGLGEARHPLFTELDTIATSLGDLRARAFGDPMSLYSGEPGTGRPDLADGERLAARLDTVLGKLDSLATVRAELDERVARASLAIDGVVAEEAEARKAYDLVLEKIAEPVIVPVPDGAAPLRAQLGSVHALVARHEWAEVSSTLEGLASATEAARQRAAAVRETAAALLGRRAELRGRLDAYRVKAAQWRILEDPEIAARYQEAYEKLWTVPCDLRGATKALNRYQQAIAARGRQS
jgi:hypothetical protein